jgi:hypothetical protein
MSKVKNTRNKIKSRLEVIKKINDDPSVLTESLSDKYLSNLQNNSDIVGKKLDSFLEKRKTKNENNGDILSELVDIFENFLTTTKKVESSDRLFYQNKLKQHALDSTQKVLNESKKIISNNVKKVFFVDDGICGVDKKIPKDTSIFIEPKEFDFLNMLTINPQTSMGQIVYESEKTSNKEKINLNIYNSFTNPNGYTLNSTYPDVNTLFNMTWNGNSQQFLVSDFFDNQNNNDILKIEDFVNDYYSIMELPDLKHIINNAMLLTLQGDGTETQLFNKSINNLDRLLKKIFKICGTSTKREELINQSPVDFFDENDEDIEFFFNFEDVEGIDIDDENNRLRKVMKFTDCNNFEIPVNTTMINDFIYLSSKKNINDLVNDTLSRTATDVYVRSESSIPQTNFNISLINTFILNIPKALIMSLISPKVILPIVIVYKILKGNTFLDVKELMKKLSKLFFNIIKDMYWLFIRSFWSMVKVDLLAFVSSLVQKILRNKFKRNLLIINSLIFILNKILESGVNNCEDLFNLILNTIDNALATKSPFNVPGILLSLSDLLPGYSQDRAFLNITERLQASGISLDPIFGEGNDLPLLVKSIIDGNTEEMDTNSFVKVVLKPSVLPGPTGGAVVPPGVISAVGKWI